MENKKIKNATPMTYDGIKFRSKLEVYCYKQLKEAGIETDYEGKKYTLLPKFEYNDEKIRPITFTPDFPATNGSFIIECKGFPNDGFPNKWKMFKALLHKVFGSYGPRVFVVRNQKQVRDVINILKNL